MRKFFMMLVVLGVAACAPQPSTDAEPTLDMGPPVAQVELEGITMHDGFLEGEFQGDYFRHRATGFNGHSNGEVTRVEVITEPTDNNRVFMALTTFYGNLAQDTTLEPDSRGCAGPAVDMWDYDRAAIDQVVEVSEDNGLHTVSFDLLFEDGEWLAGSYQFSLN